MIRKSIVEYPVMEYDGDEVTTVFSSGSYIDSDVTPDVTYFYTLFPFRGADLYNYDETNRLTITVRSYNYYFGFDIDIDDPNPDTRVSYPNDVDNYNYTPAKMISGTGAHFDYGDWPSTAGDKFMPRPCTLGFDGIVEKYLDQNNYMNDIDGSWADIRSPGSNRDVMVEWPKIFVKRWEENGVYHFRCTDVKLDSGYECWSNYDKNNNEIDHFYISAYPVGYGGDEYYYSEAYRSLFGQPVETFSSISQYAIDRIRYTSKGVTYRTDIWSPEVLADYLLMDDLLIMMAKTTDLQNAYKFTNLELDDETEDGKPISEGYRAGVYNYKGLFHYSKLFGIEFINSRLLAGWFYNNGVQKVKITQGTKDGTTSSDYNLTGNGYVTLQNSGITTSNGYLKTCLTLPYGRFPKDNSGSSTTYETKLVNCGNASQIPVRIGRFNQVINLRALYSNDQCLFMSCKPLATS